MLFTVVNLFAILVQILEAKIRRLEHLVHLKDIRVDDLQLRLERQEKQLRPTAAVQHNKFHRTAVRPPPKR